jgi:hypothetical protein
VAYAAATGLIRPPGITLPPNGVRAPLVPVTLKGSNTCVGNSLRSPRRIFSVGTV